MTRVQLLASPWRGYPNPHRTDHEIRVNPMSSGHSRVDGGRVVDWTLQRTDVILTDMLLLTGLMEFLAAQKTVHSVNVSERMFCSINLIW